jgi:DNA-binding SARP family transcriptional activator/ATP/maltotriose-dependent transcriptional regulator MalT
MALRNQFAGSARPPRFVGTLERSRLLVLADSGASLVLLCAPGGYGKTVLAAQIAAYPRFEESFWISVPERGLGSGSIASLLSLANSQHDAADVSLLMPDAMQGSTDELIAALNERCSNASVCIVVDGLSSEDATGCTLELRRVFEALGPGSLLVVTSREDCQALAAGFPEMWTVGSQELAFTRLEIRELLGGISEDVAGGEVERLEEATAGHPALVAVLGRHAILRGGAEGTGEPPLALLQLVHRMASDYLDHQQMQLVWAAALLGSGDQALLRRVVPSHTEGLHKAAEVFPLLRLTELQDGSLGFEMHDLARGALLADDAVPLEADAREAIRHCAYDELVGARRVDEFLMLVLRVGSDDELIQQLARHAPRLLARARMDLVAQALASVDASLLVREPRVMLLAAQIERERTDYEQALRMVQACAEISQHDRDRLLERDSLLLTARLRVDSGDISGAEATLKALVSRSRELGLSPDDEAFATAHLVICSLHLGMIEAAEAHETRALERAETDALSVGAQAFLTLARSMAAYYRGDFPQMAALLLQVASMEDAPRSLRLQAKNNAGYTFLRMGRIESATRVLEEVRNESIAAHLTRPERFSSVGLAACYALQGETEASAEAARTGSSSPNDGSTDWLILTVELSELRRLLGHTVESLRLAEDAVRLAESFPELRREGVLARVELCASQLASGDDSIAFANASELRNELEGASGLWEAACAVELVLTAAALKRGDSDEAVSRISLLEEDVLTERSNLAIAAWVRTLPAMLWPLAAAIGPDRLPSHMLTLIDAKSAGEGLREAWTRLSHEQWEVLARRLLPDDERERLEAELRDADACQVRFFGGLEVRTPEGIVPDGRWRKRKARLVFAMLVVRRGQDVPRDLLLEHLWPEMDEERARNNFYVVWNALRSALDPHGSLGERCSYVESRGGICRSLTGSVRTDLDNFDDLARLLREAVSMGDADGVRDTLDALDRVYVGEVLPGDVYDDWFGETREHYRQSFVDLVVRGAVVLREAGEHATASEFLRRALSHDSVNEDVVRELIRCQIAAGQRTAAIETYMACRERLAETLGLDPSDETSSLYGDILAMEDDMNERTAN